MENSSSVAGLFGGLIYLVFIVAVFAGMWKMFTKAGKPGWASLIPIYNLVVLHEIIGRDIWKLVLLLVPFVNIYFGITLYVSLAKSFGKNDIVSYLLTIFFAPFYLGFGSATYVGPSEGSNAGALANAF